MKFRIITIVLSLFLVGFFLHAQNVKKQDNPKKQQPKNVKDYKKSWSEVDSLEKLDLPKTILPLVEGIYAKAKAENNTSEQIKSLLYILRYRNILEENGAEKNMRWLKSEITSAKQPAKSLMQSVYAQNLESYYNSESWKILSQTKQEQKTPDSLSHWNVLDFEREIKNWYLESISQKKLLQKEPVRKFETILQTYPGSDTLRPTLYDLLAHHALNYFTSNNINRTEAAAEENLNALELFDDAKAFLGLNLYGLLPQLNKDDPKIHALKIYQELLDFHLLDSESYALTDADLARLKYVHQILTVETKNEAYYKAILNVENRTQNHEASAEAGFVRAEFILQGYRPIGSDTMISLPKLALEICEKYIAKYPNSFGGKNCAHLKSTILEKNFSILTEQTYLPNTPLKFYLSYKNIGTIYYRVIKFPMHLFEKENNYYDQKTFETLIKITPIEEKEIKLLGAEDLLQHSTEIMLQSLDFGIYAVLVSADKDFSTQKNQLTWSKFIITNLAAVAESRPLESKTLHYVRDAKNGSPIKGAEVKIFKSIFNTTTRNYDKELVETKITNSKGEIELFPGDVPSNYTFEIRKGKDFLPVEDGIYLNHFSNTENIQTRTFFFIDRSIYRPGQTVYFKGIKLQNNAKGTEPKILSNQRSTVQFRNANGELINEKDFTTNEYGSFNGNFQIPNNLLSGNFSLQDENGSVSIQVEEYKRPQFEVRLDTLKNSFRLNEKIAQSGKAETYSGAALNNASIKYRVTRQANFPIWRWWKSFPHSLPTEIANGTTQTDANGNFKFDFIASPDPKLKKEDKPEFTYYITVDVTSQSGETQSTETAIRIGYTALQAQIDVEQWLDNSTSQTVVIQTKNLSGQDVKTTGKLKIEKLKEPEKPFRQRLWEKPDKPVLSREDFVKHFPHDAYMDENMIYNYPVEKLLFEENISSQTPVNLPEKELKNWPAGNYKITFSAKDTFGEIVESVKFINIYNPKSKKPAVSELFYFIPHKIKNINPGEKAVLIVGSAVNTNVHIVAEHSGKVVFDEWISLKNKQQKVEIPVKEAHREGIFVSMIAIAENRFFEQREKIEVAWPKRNLEITTASWRDKTKPGAKEKWTFTIKGPDAEKAAAEMLAGMYDASLDAFLPHKWNFDINPEIYPMLYTNALGFGSVAGGIEYNGNWNEYFRRQYRSYDELIFTFYEVFYGYAPPQFIMDQTSSENMVITGKDARYIAKIEANSAVAVTGGVVQENEFLQQENIQQKPLTHIRKNKQELAFFYPELRTNENGEISFEFTMPDALTRWKFMAFAHSKDLKYGAYQNSIITQKELMVQPNLPRFLRAGDEIEFSANVTNLSGEDFKSEVRIKLFDAYNMKFLGDEIMENKASATQNINLQNGETKNIRWKIKTPHNSDGIMYQLIASTGKFSDGEEGLIPILSNRILVTETLPMYVRGYSSKNYNFTALTKPSKSATPYKLTLEIASNPAWYAVQALPFLMENQYENAEQIFNRFYANAIAQNIVQQNPEIKTIFESWKSGTALQSNLEKNQELKNILLQETPWLAEGRNESERKQRIALLFDENNVDINLENALSKLEQMQQPDGGWPWFEGMRTDRFITQYIVAGLGKLEKLSVQSGHIERVRKMLMPAVIYMEEQMLADYEIIMKNPETAETTNHLNSAIVQYMYGRSFFKYIAMQVKYQRAHTYWKRQGDKFWTSLNLHNRAMYATAIFYLDERTLAQKIMHSVNEHALHGEEMGMYWKEAQTNGYAWHQQGTETQAMLIEAYEAIINDADAVEEMKLWLLKQKQTQSWRSSKATADVVYVLLMRGDKLLNNNKPLKVFFDGTLYDLSKSEIKKEQGTGYYKSSWTGSEISAEKGKIKLVKEDAGSAWGAAYYQYYQDVNAVKGNSGALSISKELFLTENSAKGNLLKPLTAKSTLKTGDLLTVKIRIKTDRNLEYVHVKDMRAAALEPVETLSGYQWKGNLGFYQAIKDASTNFFISYLPKGEYTFEYKLRVSQSGVFNNGIAQIQCYYAPEFSGHTGSMNLKVIND